MDAFTPLSHPPNCFEEFLVEIGVWAWGPLQHFQSTFGQLAEAHEGFTKPWGGLIKFTCSLVFLGKGQKQEFRNVPLHPFLCRTGRAPIFRNVDASA